MTRAARVKTVKAKSGAKAKNPVRTHAPALPSARRNTLTLKPSNSERLSTTAPSAATQLRGRSSEAGVRYSSRQAPEAASVAASISSKPTGPQKRATQSNSKTAAPRKAYKDHVVSIDQFIQRSKVSKNVASEVRSYLYHMNPTKQTLPARRALNRLVKDLQTLEKAVKNLDVGYRSQQMSAYTRKQFALIDQLNAVLEEFSGNPEYNNINANSILKGVGLASGELRRILRTHAQEQVDPDETHRIRINGQEVPGLTYEMARKEYIKSLARKNKITMGEARALEQYQLARLTKSAFYSWNRGAWMDQYGRAIDTRRTDELIITAWNKRFNTRFRTIDEVMLAWMQNEEVSRNLLDAYSRQVWMIGNVQTISDTDRMPDDWYNNVEPTTSPIIPTNDVMLFGSRDPAFFAPSYPAGLPGLVSAGGPVEY